MINRWMGDIALLLQARIGVTSALIVWAAVVVIASLTTFVFLCVACYDWLSLQWGAALAGLAMASAFLVIALIGAAFSRVTPPRQTARDACTRCTGTGVSAPIARSKNSWRRNAGRSYVWLATRRNAGPGSRSRGSIDACKPTATASVRPIAAVRILGALGHVNLRSAN